MSTSAVLATPIIYVNGSPTTVTAIVRDNQVFVPVHGLFEKLDTTVTATPSHAVVAHKANADIAQLAVASRTATVNGGARTLAAAPFMSKSTLFVPLRLISEAAGATVIYSAASHAIHITSAPQVAVVAPVAAAAPVSVASPTDVVAPVTQQHGIPWWVWLLLALVVLALLLAFFRRRKPEPIITTRSTPSEPIIKTRR